MILLWRTMPPGLDLRLQWKINVNDHPRSLQVTNIMATINDSLHHLDLAEEAVVSAPNIEDMLVRMSLMATMAEGMKVSLGMALVGLDADIRRTAMRNNSLMGMCYIDDTLVRTVDTERWSLLWSAGY